YSVLLPVGFAVPPPLPKTRCALTAPFHPCRGRYATRRGGLFSVALSLGPACAGPAGCYPAPFVRGARTFLPGRLSALVGAAVRPTDVLGMGPTQHRVKGRDLGRRVLAQLEQPAQRIQRRVVDHAVDPGRTEMTLEGGDHLPGGGIVATGFVEAVAVVDQGPLQGATLLAGIARRRPLLA